MRFFAVATQGLVDALEIELQELGFETTEKTPSGVYFESSLKGCYRANLMSTIASRILMPLYEGRAREGEDLYELMNQFDFSGLFSVKKTMKIDAVVKDCSIRDQRFVAMKVKDVIADQFRTAFGERPNVDTLNPQVRFFVKGYQDYYMIAIDTSGEALFRRGYRLQQGEAPLKETLASGLLKYSGWQPGMVLVDPMCGSGTFLIEAAQRVLKMAAGGTRKGFGFEHLANFDKLGWEKTVQQSLSGELEIPKETPIRLFGYDVDKRVLEMAKENARRAGVDHLIVFQKRSIAELSPPRVLNEDGTVDTTPGIVIANPPYAARLGEMHELKDVYRDFSHSLKHRFHGWTAWLLSGNKELMAELKLKATRKIFVFNGAIECRFLKYEMFQGAPEARVYRSSKKEEQTEAQLS